MISSVPRLLVVLALGALATSALHAQCPDGAPPPCLPRAPRPGASSNPNSVAVLYFENLSRDTTDAYLADGLTEDITAKLGQISRLAVTSRAAMRRLREAAAMPTAALGRTLNVDYLVSGSIQRSGARLRVTVELVRARSGSRLWGDQYDRTAADLLAIQEDIARAVATGIAGQLLPAERATLVARPTRSPVAYDHYLRGNRLLWREVETSVLGAITEYEAALRLDPAFVAARGRLAYTYGLALNWSYRPEALPPESVLTRGAAAVARALQEDSSVSDAWLGRGLVLFFGGRRQDLDIAVESLRRAVELNPGDDAAHNWYAVVLRRLGRFPEAEQEYRRALVINPSRLQSITDQGFLAYSRRRFAEARQWYDSGVALDSTVSVNYLFRARVRLELGELAGALEDAGTALRLAAPSERLRASALLAEMEARNGQTDRAQQRLQRTFDQLGWPSGVPTAAISVRDAYDPALAAVALGEYDVARAIVERARPRGPWLWSYLIFPGFDPIRSDPRFLQVFQESKPPGVQ